MNTFYEILEIDYSVSPGGVNLFEVYDTRDKNHWSPPVYESENLTEAVNYCYNLGYNFTVKTLAQWEREQNYV